MTDAWHFLGSTPLHHLGKLTLREDGPEEADSAEPGLRE